MYVVLPPGAALEVQIKLSVISVFIFADKKNKCNQCVNTCAHKGGQS